MVNVTSPSCPSLNKRHGRPSKTASIGSFSAVSFVSRWKNVHRMYAVRLFSMVAKMFQVLMVGVLPELDSIFWPLWHAQCREVFWVPEPEQKPLPRPLFASNSSSHATECAMLVLTRKAKQRIQIGDNISITVLRVKGQTVRIGIDATTEVRVRRSELAAFDSEDRSVGSTNVASVSPERSCPSIRRSDSERDESLSNPFRSNPRVRNRTKNIQRESQTTC